MTGCGIRSAANMTAWPRPPKASAPSEERFAISLMSAPAANDFSPAPVMTTARTERSPAIDSRAARRRSSCGVSNAFSACGRLSVTVATAPSRLTSTAIGVSFPHARPWLPPVADVVGDVARRVVERMLPAGQIEAAGFARRDAHRQRAVGDDGVFGHQRAGGDDRAVAD